MLYPVELQAHVLKTISMRTTSGLRLSFKSKRYQLD